MKVLHIIDSLGLGGAQTVVKGIFESQQDNSDIFLYVLRQRNITTNINHKNVLIHDSSSKYSLKPLLELKNIIDREKIDVLHCHLFRSNVFGWLLKMIWFPKIKLLIHEHGGIGLKEIGYCKFLRIADSKIDRYIAISKYVVGLLRENSNIHAEKILTLYNFVDLEKFSQKNANHDVNAERAKLGFLKNDFVIGFSGRLIESKGWREFVESAKIINRKHPQTRFLIAGNGVDREKLLKTINGHDFIKYIGYVSDMPNYYRMLDCFVMPSHTEPMGLTQLEAQACGVPVVASNIDGLREVVNDKIDCLLFKKGDPEDLAEKIQILINSSEARKSMIDASMDNVNNFSLKKYISQMSHIYDR